MNQQFLLRSNAHLAHFTCGLNPKLGGVVSGIELSTMNLARYGIGGTVISLGNSTESLVAAEPSVAQMRTGGVKVLTTPSWFTNSYGLGGNFGIQKKLNASSNYSLIILHQVYTLSTLLGYRYAKKYRIPYAVKPHGSLTHYHESDSKLIKFLAKKLIISKILREANAIIVTCDSEKYDLDISLQSKVCNLQYGAAMDDQLVQGNFRAMGVSKGTRIMFSGRFDKKKNLPLLFNAMPRILIKYPNLILDIAGSGSAREIRDLENLIQTLGLEKNIEFHGWIDKTKMDELFNSTRLLVLPSENENFALVVSEALSAGVPCVVSKFVGTSDIVAKHHAGEIIDDLTPESVAASVIKVLEGDENTYRDAAIAATREDLDWSKIALKWKALISSLAVE